MTAYAVNSIGSNVAVTPVTYQIRVAQVVGNVVGYNSPPNGSPEIGTLQVAYYTSGVTGGTSNPIIPMRQGSPASTATAKYNVTGVGTANIIHSSGATGVDAVSASLSFQPPVDFLISPGSAVWAQLTGGGPTTVTFNLIIFFEELRLSWHY
jgi:hypothetical protein